MIVVYNRHEFVVRSGLKHVYTNVCYFFLFSPLKGEGHNTLMDYHYLQMMIMEYVKSISFSISV